MLILPQLYFDEPAFIVRNLISRQTGRHFCLFYKVCLPVAGVFKQTLCLI